MMRLPTKQLAFTAAINSSAFSSEREIHLKYEVFLMVR
jgi:hypothetical protein